MLHLLMIFNGLIYFYFVNVVFMMGMFNVDVFIDNWEIGSNLISFRN